VAKIVQSVPKTRAFGGSPVANQKSGSYVKPGVPAPKGQGTVPKAAGGKGAAMHTQALKRPPTAF
jgi:hypothetical protein